MKICLLEDEIDQARRLSDLLIKNEHHCEFYHTGQSCLGAANKHQYDLYILDWQLPDMDGTDVLIEMRQNMKINTPVLFLTQRDAEQDIVTALKSGADDYLTKPAREAELIARIDALGRRVSTSAGLREEEHHGLFTINYQNRAIKLNNENIAVTEKDFELAAIMFQNKGKLLSREFLLERVWGISSSLNTRTVDTHVSRLRRRIGLKPENGFRIKTVYQHGYRLESLNQ
jgi:DNA-binding response OmpR family regulator